MPLCFRHRLNPTLFKLEKSIGLDAMYIQNANFFLSHDLSSFCTSLEPPSAPRHSQAIKIGVPANASIPGMRTSSTWCCCPSLRWHYPDQVLAVGGAPFQPGFPELPWRTIDMLNNNDQSATMKYNIHDGSSCCVLLVVSMCCSAWLSLCPIATHFEGVTIPGWLLRVQSGRHRAPRNRDTRPH